jgi:hypothetical protein
MTATLGFSIFRADHKKVLLMFNATWANRSHVASVCPNQGGFGRDLIGRFFERAHHLEAVQKTMSFSEMPGSLSGHRSWINHRNRKGYS